MIDGTPADHDPPARPLREVRGYELLDEIDAGGMAHVYRARRIADGAIVALKVVHIDNMAPDYEARLRREPEVQRGIGHDNIVRLEESFRLHDEFFLVMEYVDGRSLARMIHAESGPLGFERARGYFRQVLRAVDHLHRVGIVHRDIKPSNILVGWDDVVKLADFGIAKFIWQQGATATRQGLGTPQYMSPEQVRGESIDQRTDIYSLGATFFEMLTGRMPFSREASTPIAYAEVIRAVLEAPLPDPRTFQPLIPPEAVRLIERATAKNPADRFASVEAMAAALDAIASDPISPPTLVLGRAAGAAGEPGAPLVSPRRWRPDRPTLLIVLLFLGLLAVAISMMTRGKGSAVTPSPALDGSRMLVITADIARRYEQGMRGCAADSVAGLYAPNGVSYFKQGVLGRAAILADIGAFCDRVLAVDPFTVRIDSMRSAGDGIDAWWTVVSGRTLRGDTLYRDTSADLLHIAPRDGGWSITAQRHLWSKHYSVGPPAKPRPIVSRPRPRQTVTPARAVEIHLPPPKGRLKKLEGGLERGGKRGGGKGHRRARGG